MSLKQNILKLLEGYTIVDGDAEISDGNILPSQGSDTDSVSVVENGERKIDRIISLIEQEVRKCVPEERNECKTLSEFGREYNIKNGYPEDYSPPDDIAVGFNASRQQVLNNITKLFNE